MAEQAAAAGGGGGGGGGGQIILQQPGQPPVALNNEQVVQVIQQLQSEVEKLKEENRILQAKNTFLLQNQAPPPHTHDTTSSENIADKDTIYM